MGLWRNGEDEDLRKVVYGQYFKDCDKLFYAVISL